MERIHRASEDLFSDPERGLLDYSKAETKPEILSTLDRFFSKVDCSLVEKMRASFIGSLEAAKRYKPISIDVERISRAIEEGSPLPKVKCFHSPPVSPTRQRD